MPYTTLILSLLEQQPALYQELRTSKTLLETLNRLAHTLKARHSHWIAALHQKRPDSAPEQIASEALEIALQEVRDTLPTDSPPSDPELSLDAAMAFLRRHTSPA